MTKKLVPWSRSIHPKFQSVCESVEKNFFCIIIEEIGKSGWNLNVIFIALVIEPSWPYPISLVTKNNAFHFSGHFTSSYYALYSEMPS